MEKADIQLAVALAAGESGSPRVSESAQGRTFLIHLAADWHTAVAVQKL